MKALKNICKITLALAAILANLQLAACAVSPATEEASNQNVVPEQAAPTQENISANTVPVDLPELQQIEKPAKVNRPLILRFSDPENKLDAQKLKSGITVRKIDENNQEKTASVLVICQQMLGYSTTDCFLVETQAQFGDLPADWSEAPTQYQISINSEAAGIQVAGNLQSEVTAGIFFQSNAVPPSNGNSIQNAISILTPQNISQVP